CWGPPFAGEAVMTVAVGIVLCVAALVVGALVGAKLLAGPKSAMPEAERQKLVDAARAEATELKRAAALEAQEKALEATAQADRGRGEERGRGEVEAHPRHRDPALRRRVRHRAHRQRGAAAVG